MLRQLFLLVLLLGHMGCGNNKTTNSTASLDSSNGTNGVTTAPDLITLSNNALSGQPLVPDSAGGNSNVSILLKDAAADDYDQVNVWISGIEFCTSAGACQAVTFSATPVDLLKLQNSAISLINVKLNTNTYSFVRMTFSKISVVPKGSQTTVNAQLNPSVLEVPTSFATTSTTKLAVLLDVDVNASLSANQGTYNFTPKGTVPLVAPIVNSKVGTPLYNGSTDTPTNNYTPPPVSNPSPLNYTFSGSVAGLTFGTVTLQINSQAFSAANGSFNQVVALTPGATYNVSVSQQPAGFICTLSGVLTGTLTSTTTTLGDLSVSCERQQYTVGGTLSGLRASRGGLLTLEDGNGNSLDTISLNDGPSEFVFSTRIAYNSGFNMVIQEEDQPQGQTCTVSHGSGTVYYRITDVEVTCVDNPYTVSVTVSGLDDNHSFTLQNSSVSDTLAVTENGAHSFEQTLLWDDAYNVSVSEQPVGQTCTVSEGSGTVSGAVSLEVICTNNLYYLTVHVSGIAEHNTLIVTNGEDTLSFESNDSSKDFTFQIRYLSAYSASISNRSTLTGQTCDFSGDSSGNMAAGGSSVTLVCTNNPYDLNVSVTGLATGNTLILQNGDNVQDTVTLTHDTSTGKFNNPVRYLSTYAVTLSNTSTTTGQDCSVDQNGSGTMGAEAATVTVTCTNKTYSIGVNVTGLIENTSLTLTNNETDEITYPTASTFANPVAYQANYEVRITEQPTGQTCAFSQSVLGHPHSLTYKGPLVSGTMGAENLTVNIVCTPNNYDLKVSASGLIFSHEESVVVQNGDDRVTLTANGSDSVLSSVAYHSSYEVSVFTQPNGQTCRVVSGSGTMGAENTTLTVSCSPRSYTLSGSVSGLHDPRDSISVTYTDLDAAGAAGNQNPDNTVVMTPNSTTFQFENKAPYSHRYSLSLNLHAQTLGNPSECHFTSSSSDSLTDTLYPAEDVTGIGIVCTDKFSISGTATGIAEAQNQTVPTLTLALSSSTTDNLGTATVTASNASFTFTQEVIFGDTYTVKVQQNPENQTCTFSTHNEDNGTDTYHGTLNEAANVTGISLNCVSNGHSIGGTVSGQTGEFALSLTVNNQVVVTSQSVDSSDTEFTFIGVTVLPEDTYSVSIASHPSGQFCQIRNGSGVAENTDITNIQITCTTYALVIYSPASVVLGTSYSTRSTADELCVTNKPNDLSCNNVHALASFSSDNMKDMAQKYEYSTTLPVISTSAKQIAANFPSLFTGLVQSFASASVTSAPFWWSYSNYRGEYYHPLDWWTSCLSEFNYGALGKTNETDSQAINPTYDNGFGVYCYHEYAALCICATSPVS